MKLPRKGEKGFRSIRSSGEPLIGNVNEAVAKEVGLTRATFQLGEAVLKDDPKLWMEEVKTGKLTINEGYNKCRKNKRLEELAIADAGIRLPAEVNLIQGDLLQSSKDIPVNAVDLIFTDPPHGMDSLHSYNDLALLSASSEKWR